MREVLQQAPVASPVKGGGLLGEILKLILQESARPYKKFLHYIFLREKQVGKLLSVYFASSFFSFCKCCCSQGAISALSLKVL